MERRTSDTQTDTERRTRPKEQLEKWRGVDPQPNRDSPWRAGETVRKEIATGVCERTTYVH